jgi:DNA-repair protein XRCC3
MKAENRIKLIIIDSIAALFRHEYASNESIDRAKILWRQVGKWLFLNKSFEANSLKLLSEDNTAVVVVNQVSDFFHDTPVMGTGIVSTTRKVIPALGLTWSNCVNSRILISK